MLNKGTVINLTPASVKEAFEDYIQKHMAPTVAIVVDSYEVNGYGNTGVSVHFQQANPSSEVKIP